MRGTCFADRFGRVLGIVLSGLLMLSVCATASFAEQIEATPEDVVADENPVVETQGMDEVICQDVMHSVSYHNMYIGDDGEKHSGDEYGTVRGVDTTSEGSTVTLTVTPTDSNLYILDELKVDKTGGVSPSTVEVHKESETEYTFTMPSGHDVMVTAIFCKWLTHDGQEFTPWEYDDHLPDHPGCSYYLTKDVTLTNTWTVPCGGGDLPTNLDLNGKKITLGQVNDKPVIRVAQDNNHGTPCKFVLYDREGNLGAITHANGNLGGGVQVDKGGGFVMKGGDISGNNMDDRSGGYGGGVFVNGGTFTMEGGIIANNTRAYRGGGVAVKGGTFTMSGGTIQKNGGDGVQYGGGVYVGDNGTFDLSGGTITQNAARNGGGVAGVFDFQISVSGNPRVTGNQASENPGSRPMGKNLCLVWPNNGNRTPITISGALGEDAKIGISTILDNSLSESLGGTREYTDGIFTERYRAAQSTDPWNYFISDNPDHEVLWTPDGTEAQLTTPRNITVAQGIAGGTVTPSRNKAAEGETIAIQAMPDKGWELVSVTAKDANGNNVPVKDNKELVVPASEVVVSATFKKKATPAPTPKPEPTPTPTPVPAKASKPSTIAHPTKGTIDAKWKAVAEAKSYELSWRVAGGKWKTKAVKGTSYTIKGLKAGKLYDVRVRGVDGSARGTRSKATRRWLKSASKVKAKPGKAEGSIKVSWKKDKKATGGYKVFVYARRGGKVVATKVVSKSKASATIKGLKSGKTYYARMRPYRTKGSVTYVGALSGYRSAKAK